MARRSSLILTTAALALGAVGCGGDDNPDTTASTTPETAYAASPEARAAQDAVIAYFLSKDPASCTEDATKHHIRVDYGGDLARCQAVRRNNSLTGADFKIAGQEINGDRAKVRGQVLVTAETFVVDLKKVDGVWKIDRLRGSQ